MIYTNRKCEKEISDLRKRLGMDYEMKDLGSLRYYLGIEVAYSERGLFLSQRKYVMDILPETGILGCKPIISPIKWTIGYRKRWVVSRDKERYRECLVNYDFFPILELI